MTPPDCHVTLPSQSLAAHCHTLRHISLMGGTTLTDHTFKRLALANKKLKSIRIESELMTTPILLTTPTLINTPILLTMFTLLTTSNY